MTKNTIISRLTGVAVTGALVAQSALPAFAALQVTINGNGADSNNDVDFKHTSEVTVVQENDVDIKNDVDLEANTGDNEIEKNTGADIDVETGDVDQDVEIHNAAGANTATVEDCGCELDVEVEIVKNGADSDNDVDFTRKTTKELFQENDVDVDNDVDLDAETGDNEIEKNTGGGVELTTGDVEQDVMVHTQAGMNAGDLGGNGDGSTLELTIEENGADSENDIDIKVVANTVAAQENDIDVDTDVDADADTGDNDVEKNTGGDLDIETGDVDQAADVANAAGYNALTGGSCDCELDGSVVIDKNGADSENDFDLVWKTLLEFFQGGKDSDVDLDSDVDFDGETGDNDVEKNTGDDLTTGNVDQETTLTNEAGTNVIGGDVDVEVDVDMDMLMALLHLLFN